MATRMFASLDQGRPCDGIAYFWAQVRSMKTKMEYTTVEKIDEQLRRMESQLQHTSMPLAEEKKIVENMEKLRKSRV
jgi:uncharacterized coiled-coil DUF342 family protein